MNKQGIILPIKLYKKASNVEIERFLRLKLKAKGIDIFASKDGIMAINITASHK